MLHLKDMRQTKIFPILHFAYSQGPCASTSSFDPLKCVTQDSISKGHIFKGKFPENQEYSHFQMWLLVQKGKVTVNGVIRVSKYHILQMYFLTSFSPNPQITIILLIRVLFQYEIMNIILVCNLQKSNLVLYLDFAATCQKLTEVHLYPTSPPYLGEFSVSSPYYLGQRRSKVIQFALH